jgi:ABC-type multidrug transport system fused ATPase/permease subunit
MLKKYFKLLAYLFVLAWPQTRAYKVRIFVSYFIILLAVVFSVASPLLFGYMVNSLEDSSNPVTIIYVSMSYACIWSLSHILLNTREILMIKVIERSSRNISLKFLYKVFQLPFYVIEQLKKGFLLNTALRIRQCVNDVIWAIFFLITPIVIEIIFILYIIIAKYSYYYFLVFFFVILSYVLFVIKCIPWTINSQEKSFESSEEVTNTIEDSIKNLFLIKEYNLEQKQLSLCNNKLKIQESWNIKYSFNIELLKLLQTLIIVAGFIIICYLCANDIYKKNITIGDFVAITGYLIQFINPFSVLGFVIRDFIKGISGLEKIFNIIQMSKEGDLSNSKQRLERVNYLSLEVKNLYFYYEKTKVLHDINMNIESGQTIAIVGESGAGKSTLSKLMLGFYPIQQGDILLNGATISKVNLKSWRKEISSISQISNLLNETIIDNILLGSDKDSSNNLDTILRCCNIDSILLKKLGSDKQKFGPGGVNLSEGEKQRVTIARALMKNSSILLFDEATSFLDAANEEKIMKYIMNESSFKIKILITHRLNNIVNSDTIYVLQEGKIIESGKHKELLKKGNLYKELWDKQNNSI